MPVRVRPFRNLSQDGSQSFFSEGMTDEIRGQLSKISALRVLSRSAVDQFGGADGPTIAREFGTSHLVEGSVRVDGTGCEWPSSWSTRLRNRRDGRSSTIASSPTFSGCRARWRCRSPGDWRRRCRPRNARASNTGPRRIPRLDDSQEQPRRSHAHHAPETEV